MVGRTGAKEEALSFSFFFISFGGGGVRRRRRPLYLYNCTSWFMGFREVLCVSFAGRPGDMGRAGGGWSLAFVMINIQADSHLEPRLALPGFGFIYICMYFFFFFYYCYVFFWYFMHLLCSIFSLSPFLFANSLR